MPPVVSVFILTLLDLALATQFSRIGVALRSGKTYRLRWLILSIVMISMMCSGALLMPASPAVIFTSAAGALKAALSFLLILGGSRLTRPVSQAMRVLPDGDLRR